MLISTTHSIEGMRIAAYYGIVSGETIIGANLVRDFLASIYYRCYWWSFGQLRESVAGSKRNCPGGDEPTGKKNGRQCYYRGGSRLRNNWEQRQYAYGFRIGNGSEN